MIDTDLALLRQLVGRTAADGPVAVNMAMNRLTDAGMVNWTVRRGAYRTAYNVTVTVKGLAALDMTA